MQTSSSLDSQDSCRAVGGDKNHFSKRLNTSRSSEFLEVSTGKAARKNKAWDSSAQWVNFMECPAQQPQVQQQQLVTAVSHLESPAQ